MTDHHFAKMSATMYNRVKNLTSMMTRARVAASTKWVISPIEVANLPLRTLLWLIAAVLLAVGLALVHSPLQPLPGVMTLLVVPGAAVLTSLRTRPATTAGRLVLAVSLSLLVVMVVGGASSIVGPWFGFARPLDPLPQYLVWSLLALLMLKYMAATKSDPVEWVFEQVRISQIYALLACALLICLSILGVAQLNHSGDAHLAIVSTVLDVLTLLVGVVGGWRRENRWPLNTMLYCVSLALLLSASLRGGGLYGWDVQREFGVASQTLRSGRWAIPANHDPYASMLSITVLPTVLASLTKLRLLAFFQLIAPAILALFPVAIFTTVSNVPRLITILRPAPRPGIAFATTAVFVIASQAYSSELVSITRQAMALTMLSALVIVLYDRTMLKRSSQVIIALLIIEISFSHYTTSYLLAGILALAWPINFLWSKGWLGVPRQKMQQHRTVITSRNILNATLLVLAMVAAFGWNLGITQNYSLNSASSAFSNKGAGFVTSTGPNYIPPLQLERILTSELHRTASWLNPVRGAGAVRLEAAPTTGSTHAPSTIDHLWSSLNFLLQEGLWILAGAALLYGVVVLGRRQANHFNPDMVGFTTAVLLTGGFLRFSGTLAAFYSPSRAAIIVAIFVAAPVTMFLDDLVSLLTYRMSRILMISGVFVVGAMNIWSSGLGTLAFGGVTPSSLTAKGANVQNLTVSTPELATALWIRNNVPSTSIVQSDEYGQLVLLSHPADYHLLVEIVPTEVDQRSFVYLSATNVVKGLTTVTTNGGSLYSVYQTTFMFFDRYFNVVYSNGATRVYH